MGKRPATVRILRRRETLTAMPHELNREKPTELLMLSAGMVT